MGEELSRVEDLLATGVEEPVEPMSRVEAILRGEDIKPLSRVEDLLKNYNPPDYEYIDLSVTENGTYTPPSGKMYKKAVVDVPSQAPVLTTLNATENGTYTPEQGYDGFSSATVNVPATPLDNLSVTENGTYTPTSGHGFNEVTVDVAGSGGLKTIEHEQVATFSDGTDNFVKSLEVAIEPQQDLHGYDNPWVGGAGKNKLSNRLNTLTKNGITVTKNSDGTYTVNGTCTHDNTDFYINTESGSSIPEERLYLPNGDYKLSGISGGTSSTYRMVAVVGNPSVSYISLYDGDASFTISNDVWSAVFLRVMNGHTFNNYVIRPMIRSSNADNTFAPYSNICPISGHQAEGITRCGANMFSGEMELGSIDDTTGEEVPDNTCLRSKALYTIIVSGGVPFYGVVPFDYNGIKYYFYDRFGNFISCSGWQSKGVYTPPNDAVIVRIVLSSDYGTTYNNDISINYPSTITTYQSFSGHANLILFSDGTNPLTVYGGKLDVLNGVLTVNKVSVVYDGSNDESWVYSASWSKTNTNAFYLPGDATIKFSSWDDYPISKCNCLTPMSRNELYDADTTGIGMSGSLDGGNVSIRVPKAVSDVSELRTWLSSNNVQAVYELATPQTVQLSPTIIKSLQGANNFFASTGEIELLQYWSTDADPILSDLNVDSNGEYTPAAGHGFGVVTVDVAGVGGLEEVDLYLDEYEELTPQQKSDTTKIYFVTDEEES